MYNYQIMCSVLRVIKRYMIKNLKPQYFDTELIQIMLLGTISTRLLQNKTF